MKQEIKIEFTISAVLHINPYSDTEDPEEQVNVQPNNNDSRPETRKESTPQQRRASVDARDCIDGEAPQQKPSKQSCAPPQLLTERALRELNRMQGKTETEEQTRETEKTSSNSDNISAYNSVPV